MEGASIKHHRPAADAWWMNHTNDVEIVWEAPFFVNPVSSKVILPIHSITLRYVFFFIIYHWTSWSLILKCWNSKFFECNTLKNLGGHIQLGHAIGKPCPLPIHQQNISLLFGTCGLLDHLGSNPSKIKRVPKNHTSLLHATWSLLVQVRFSCSS